MRPASKGEVESLGATFIELTSAVSAARRGRLRPRAHRRGTPGPAGRADRAHRAARRGDHHRAGARPQAAAARHRGRGAGDGRRLGDRGHGRQRTRRQRRRLGARRDRGHARTASRSSARRTCRRPCRPPRPTPTRGTSARCCCTWSPTARCASTPTDEIQAGVVVAHDGEVVHPAVAKLLRRRPREPEEPTMSTALVTDLTIFVLALLVGIEVIGKVPATLHTPLMSAANSIHGIVLVGRAADRRHRAQRRRLRARVRGRVLRRRERGRRLRGHRPDAEDVPPQGRSPRRPTRSPGRPSRPRPAGASRSSRRGGAVMNTFTTNIQLVYVLAAACFVVGLHLMNSPATARRGNQVSTAGMVIAVDRHARPADPRRHRHRGRLDRADRRRAARLGGRPVRPPGPSR